MNFDLPVFDAINSFARATSWLHGLMLAYATYAVVLIGVLLVAGLWVARRSGDPGRVTAALWAPVGVLAAVGVNQPIVAAVHEPRPYRTVTNIAVLAQRSNDFSFPSDHAVMAGAAAAGILLITRRLLAWVTLAAALLLAFARVYIAAHYPHDVLAGLLLGAAVSVIGYRLLRRPLRNLVGALQRGRLRPLLAAGPAAAAAASGAPPPGPHRRPPDGPDPASTSASAVRRRR